MTSPWQPYREPLRVTLARTVAIALVLGAVVTRWHGGWAAWPAATLLMLWPSFGGHWVEVWFLNWLRPRIATARVVQVSARLATWFAGGIVLGLGVTVTARALPGFGPIPRHMWWLAGLAFVGIELVAHLGLQLREQASFYNGRG